MSLYRCTVCSTVTDEVIPPPRGSVVECQIHNCRGECERINTCAACDDEALDGEDVCISHAVADVVRDPLVFNFLSSHAKSAVLRAMANRLRALDLTRVQAPRATEAA
jgi:hypothetical protein